MADLLKGVKVIEYGGELAAAYCGRLLAALGADVVHVRSVGDQRIERQGPFPPGGGPAGLAGYLHMGKRVVSVEGSTGPALDALLASADLLIVGCDLREADALGLAGDALARRHPALASIVISPFGLTGPYRDYQSADLLSFVAFGRFSDAGLQPRPPIGYALHSTGFFSGTIAASAALAALKATRDSGRAVQADLSLAECILSSPDRAYTLYSFAGYPIPRPEVHREVFVLSSDGVPVLVNSGLAWSRTAPFVERPELADDPRFTTLAARAVHADEVYALVLAWAAEHTVAEISAALQKHRVMGSPLLKPHEVLNDPQYRAREFFEEMALPGAPAVQVPGVPFKVDGVRSRLSPPRDGAAEPWSAAPGARPAATAAPGSQPLAGVRVIDLGELYAGPNACSLLGDLGADVIKIENVQRMPAVVRGDRRPPATSFGYFHAESGEAPWERFHLFHTVERNKRGVTLDLKAPRGRAIFLELVKQADVVVSNYTPRALRNLGLTPGELMGVNPKLSVVHLPGFGGDGPYADRVSVGPVAEALSGHWAVRGYPDESELQSNQTVWADVVAAATASALAMAAIVGQRDGAPGVHFDLAQTEALTPFVAGEIIEHGWNGAETERNGGKHPKMAPHGAYRVVGDDAWVVLAVRDDGEWPRFARAIGRADLAADSELATLAGRKARESELDAAIADWTAGQEQQEVVRALQAQGLACVPALHDSQVVDDPQVVAREMIVTIDHPVVGQYQNPATPFRLSGIPRVQRRPPNLLGQHNAEVLTSLAGCSESDLDELTAAGIIGTTFP